MANPDREELLEIYQLHAELADRVSQRREGANRLYVSLLLALVLFLAALFRFGSGDLPSDVVVVAVAVTGAALSVSWWVVIRSYRQLNSGKLKALHELEDRLAYPFFKREWEVLGEGKDRSRYWRLTQVEAILPWIFFALCCSAAVAALSLGNGGSDCCPSDTNVTKDASVTDK